MLSKTELNVFASVVYQQISHVYVFSKNASVSYLDYQALPGRPEPFIWFLVSMALIRTRPNAD